jgi:hypothetical protein
MKAFSTSCCVSWEDLEIPSSETFASGLQFKLCLPSECQMKHIGTSEAKEGGHHLTCNPSSHIMPPNFLSALLTPLSPSPFIHL